MVDAKTAVVTIV